MKRTIIATLAICGALVLTATAQKSAASKSQAAEVALGAAIHQEEAEGNLEAAIASYKKFLAQYGSNRPLAAKAQYHLGLSYEKLGNAEARKTYEHVLQEFSDQKEIAADANRRLAALTLPQASDPRASQMLLAGDLDIGGISPDARWMAMTEWSTADGDLVVRDMANGQTKRLQTGSCGKGSSNCRFAESAIFSPDSRQVAYSWFDETENAGEAQLRIIAAEAAAKPRVLVSNPAFGIWAGGWSPDGKFIIASMRKPDRTWQLARVSVADGTIKVLKSLDWRLQGDPSLSPDGQYIAYSAFPNNPSQPPSSRFESTEQHIYVLAADGSKEVELVKTAAANQSPFWMPGSSQVGFVSNQSGKFDLWSIPVRDGNAAGSPSLLKRDIGDILPVGITRSGSYYYVQSKPGVEQISLTELVPGGGSRILESFVGVNPTWSPDGKSIAFSRHRGDNWDLVVRSFGTGDERVYAHEGLRAGPPRWFHNGKSLLQDVILPGRPRTSNSVDITSGEFKPVLSSDSYLTGIAALSPDDRTLYFPSRDPKVAANVFDRIIAADLSTGKQIQIASFAAMAVNGFGFAVSPNGSMLAIITTDAKTRQAHLAVAGADGSGYHEIDASLKTLVPYDKVAWTKDGRAILLATSDGNVNGDYQIMRIGVAGGKPEFTGLTVKALSTFDLSPDGSRIAFSTLATGTRTAELFVIDNLPALLKASQ